MSWWAVFRDPLLDSLVERAIFSNKSLQLAEARILQARAVLASTVALVSAFQGII